VKFSLRRAVLEARGRVWIRGRGQNKRWSRLQLVLERRLFGRAARQRRAVRAGGVDGLKIILGEQVERAEHLVILDVERPRGLEVTLECKHRGRLDVELLGRAHLADLSVVLLSRDPGRPPRSAAVVVVRVGGEVLWLVLATVVEKLRHGERVCWWRTGRNVGEGSVDEGRSDHNKGETKGYDSSEGRQRSRGRCKRGRTLCEGGRY
jgi:hypothetical protein